MQFLCKYLSNMRAEIISIGDELLIGQTINTNAAWMGEELGKIGIAVSHVHTIADTNEAIIGTLKALVGKADLVLMTGGLGPTKDDVTKHSLCQFFDDTLVRNQNVLAQIVEYFSRNKVELLEVHKQQADLPSKSRVLLNSRGTAQGMWLEKDKTIVISMPGVPYEMKGIFDDGLLNTLADHFETPCIYHKSVLTQGVGETTIATKLEAVDSWCGANGVSIAYLPSAGMVKIRFLKSGADQSVVEQAVDHAVEMATAVLGDMVFGLNKESLQLVVGNLLRERNLKMCSAESCTGGYLAHLITSIAGSSDYFEGSIVSYTNAMKLNILGVKESTLISHGAVSEEVVMEMAEGANRLLGTDYSVAISGIAGPSGGTEAKPVGTVG
jgi:nicotinamide-nucleotide amidase